VTKLRPVAPSNPLCQEPNFANFGIKVPAVTLSFWIIKILTTGMGETTSDFFVRRFEPVLVVGIAAAGLAAALLMQLRARSYRPWLYWLTVVMVSVFGTMAADVIHIVLGVPYLVSTLVFALALAALLITQLRDPAGRILIPGYTSDVRPLSAALTAATTSPNKSPKPSNFASRAPSPRKNPTRQSRL